MNRKERRAGASGTGQPAPSPQLAQAVQLHRSGQLAQAEAAYRRLLSQNARNPDALYLLGVLCAQKGALAEAEQLLKQATGLRPMFPDAWYNLATLYLQTKRQADAEAALKACLKQQPQHAGALWNLGNLFLDLKRFDEAENVFRRFLQLQPGNFEGLHSLAMALLGARKFCEAEAVARQALSINRQTRTRAVLGHALYEREAFDEAEVELRATVKEFPKDVEPRTLLATLLRRSGKPCELIEANEMFAKLVKDYPDDEVVRLNYSLCLKDMGRLDEAIAQADLALRLQQDDPDLRNNRALLLIQAGRLSDAWPEFHYRFQSKRQPNERRKLPMPNVSSRQEIASKTVVVWPEQGVGDQIAYASAMNELIDEARAVEILSLPKVATLFRRSFPKARVIVSSDESRAELNMPFGDLFAYYRPDLASFSGQRPYLTPDPEAVAKLKTRLDSLGPGMKVGIGWRSTMITRERKKHFFPSLLSWKPILEIPGVTFINYQPKVEPRELDEARQTFGCKIENFDDIDLFDDLDASAALGAALDLVICNGSANAFLAAATGAPVWMFYVSDSHWDRMGTQTIPWMPSLVPVERLWNESWESAVRRMADALRDSLGASALLSPLIASPLRLSQ